MFTVALAQMNIGIDNKYEYVKNMCKGYIIGESAEFVIEVSNEEIMKEAASPNTDPGYAESLAIYRKLASKVLSKNTFIMHAVVADASGVGIAFLAPSGVGKSTHAALWKKLLGNTFTYVNGDKPLVRIHNNTVYAYGTPWAGKENLHSKMTTKLEKICFIKQSKENSCVKLKKSEVLEPLLKQIYIPENASVLSFLNLLSALIENVDFYLINCNTDISAAQTACEVIFNDRD